MKVNFLAVLDVGAFVGGGSWVWGGVVSRSLFLIPLSFFNLSLVWWWSLLVLFRCRSLVVVFLLCSLSFVVVVVGCDGCLWVVCLLSFVVVVLSVVLLRCWLSGVVGCGLRWVVVWLSEVGGCGGWRCSGVVAFAGLVVV